MSWYESPNRPCAGLYVDVDRRSRGYGEQHVEDELRDLGVRYVVLPTRGKPNAVRRKIEQRRAFKRMVQGEPRLKLRMVRIATMIARTPALSKVGVTATVRMMSGATNNSSPSRIARPMRLRKIR